MISGSQPTGNSNGPSDWQQVTVAHPCVICGKADWCARDISGNVAICRRMDRHPTYGAGTAKRDKNGAQYWKYFLVPSVNGASRRTGKLAAVVNWSAEVERLAAALTVDDRGRLAEALALPTESLGVLLIGFRADDPDGPCWTFPEVDADGRVIGITRRWANGTKKAMSGGCRGLTVPAGWRDRAGPLLLPEGPTDTLALTAAGLCAVGRPSNMGGVDHLARLLAGWPRDRGIIVVGEYDGKSDGRWPGREGAERTAAALAEKLGRPVSWKLPPAGAKDVRAWLARRVADVTDWPVAGAELLTTLQVGGECASAASTFAFRWQPIASAEFFAADYRPDWLIKGAVVRGQPLVIGGGAKLLKTTLAVDLGISLASRTPWLGTFPVAVGRRVCIVSGESGPFALQETGRRICAAKAINPTSLGDSLHWQFRLPQLAVVEQLDALRAGLERDRIDAVIVDPLYLSLLSGSDAKAENLFDTGPLLLRVAQVCESVGATPILLHHTPKPAARKSEPLDLTDLAFSGTAEFARQWILLSRREAYEPGTGAHRLWMVVGGSVGHGGLYAVDVDEGQLGEDFAGRRWDVLVIPAAEARKAERDDKAAKKEQATREQADRDDNNLLIAIDSLSTDRQAVSFKAVKAKTDPPLSDKRISNSVERLVAKGVVERHPVKVKIGNGAERPAVGLRRKWRSDEKTDRWKAV
jgi:hypothetical protein